MTIAVVMGVSGSGKTTIASGIAQALGWVLLEGDAFHPPANVAKMKAGIPLTDEDRWPWLRAIAERADTLQQQGQSTVIACSALRRAYRDVLIGTRSDTVLVFLRGSGELIHDRMEHRKGHFMPPALLDSQFAVLEEPGPDENPIIADIKNPPAETISAIVTEINHRSAQGSPA